VGFTGCHREVGLDCPPQFIILTSLWLRCSGSGAA
jgi:hypothetical protein